MSIVLPPIIHRLWLGPRPMPERFKRFGAEWAAMNPGWEVHDWSWADLPEDLANMDVINDLIRRCTRGDSPELATQLADVIDYDLVHRFGGIYLNADIQPVAPLAPEMKDRDWAAMEDEAFVVNAAFGGPQGSPFWKKVLDELPIRYARGREAGVQEMNQLTGPRLLTQVHEWNPGMLHVFPRQVFNPIHFSEIERGTDGSQHAGRQFPPETVGVHYWFHRETMRKNYVD